MRIADSKRRLLRLGAAFLVGSMFLAACGSGDETASDGDEAGETADETGEPMATEELPITLIEPLSGDFSTFGVDAAQGAQLAIEEVNEDGGFDVGGTRYTFDLEIVDAESDPTVAAQAAQEAISNGVQYLLGSTLSALSDPMAAAVQRAGGDVLMMGPATTLDQFGGTDQPIFRTLPPDPLTAKQYIPVLESEFPEVESISSLMINDAIGQSVVDIYLPEFEEAGFEVLSDDMFPPDETNFLPLLNRTPEDTDGFFVGYSDSVSTSIVEAALEVGRSPVFFNRGAACQPGLDFGDRIDAYTCIIYTENPFQPSSDEAEDFFNRYEERFDLERDSNTLQALYMYDYVTLLVQAIQEAGDVTDIPAVAEALRGSTYEGVLTVGYNDEGVNTARISVGIVRSGELELLPGAEL